jgi:hypothetical protein
LHRAHGLVAARRGRADPRAEHLRHAERWAARRARLAGRDILLQHGFTAANGYLPLLLAAEAVRRAYLGTILYLALIATLSLGR